ncbi:MAG: hypothetical protein WB424_18095 [Terracidiphilus sp.]
MVPSETVSLTFLARIGGGNVQIQNGPVQLQNGTDGKQFGDDGAGLARVVDVRVFGSTILGSNGRFFLP